MSPPSPQFCTAFSGSSRIASGPLAAVAQAVRAVQALQPEAQLLIFDDATGAVVDLDPREAAGPGGSSPLREADREGETPQRGRGRPKLGVVAREVTLLPRHWEWLSAQRGGASHALRRLVDDARKADGDRSRSRAAQEAAYRFMNVMAGDRAGYEEAIRALFAGDLVRLQQAITGWPADIRVHALELSIAAIVTQEEGGQ